MPNLPLRMTSSPIRASNLLYWPIVHRPSFGYATFISSKKIMDSPVEREHLPYPSVFVNVRWSYIDTGLDPYTYTSGRWLRCDELERESRLIRFDFDALCRRIIELCPGASSITSYDKKEGGFNRVFIFHTDTAKRIVARLPFELAGPSRLTTNSEVATIKYRTF
jgi:hypothetical protein